MLASKTETHKVMLFSLFIFIALLFITQPIIAMPMSPEMVEKLRESGELQKFIDRIADARTLGVNQPSVDDYIKTKSLLSLNADAVDTFRVIVILADFSDHTASSGSISASVADFEHLLFSNDSTDGHYSMSEYYYDNSYGNFVLEGVVVGWYRLPQTYAYYVDGQNGFGSYPRNAQRMAEDAITAANPFVDYSEFDNDNNGISDGVFIVHSGPGAESTGSDNDIWSHSWSTSYTMNLDGINISGYTTEPEELYSQLITQGVFSHEYGHFLGLPDLYDTDYSSSGLGRWSLMAGGSWNSNGAYPAFFDAWCKKELGFMTPINVTANLSNQEIPTSYYSPVSYRLWENGLIGQQYFLIENRQKTNKDSGIPGSGLLIYHIDETRSGNSDETHYLVALEQADNLYHLESGANSGDPGDVWSTSTQTEFSDNSLPSTKKYNGNPTNTLVWDISASDSLMYANLDVNYSSPYFTITSTKFSDSLYGNNNGVVEVGETLTFTFTLNNSWLTATNVIGTLVSGNPDITFSTQSVNIGTVVGEGGNGSNIGNPIVFDIPLTYDPCIDSFFLTISSDNPLGEITQGLELHVGTPQIVIIDDDNGDIWEQPIVSTLGDFRITHDVYNKFLLGSPSAAYLNNYDIVVWITGSNRADIFSVADISAMQSYMDAGGNLLLSGQSVAQEISSDDLTFIQNYFKADYKSDFFYPELQGQAGTVIGDGIKLGYDNHTNQTSPEIMNLVGFGGVSEFELPIGGITGVSYDGSYKSILLSFGIEGISSLGEGSGYATLDTVFARILKFFDYGDVNTFSNPYIDTIQFPNESSPTSVVSLTPTFSWNYSDTTGASQLQYQIQVGTGTFCINSNDMWDSGLLSGSLDSIVYNGAFLQEGSSYFIRIRAYNGSDWSSWRRTTFTMKAPNIAPQAGSLITPINNIHVSSNTPELIVNNGTDENNDVLTYDFEVYSDALLTALVTSTSLVAEGIGTTSWIVDVPLNEDVQYFWRSRLSDGVVYTSYSETGSFYVNQFNQSPVAFNLLFPGDTTELVGINPTFRWNASSDPDAGDSVIYTLVYSDDSLFSLPVVHNTAGDTSFVVVSPLVDKVVYFWKVYATDIANDTTTSLGTFSFNTGANGCCVDTRGNVDNDIADITDISDLVFLVDFMFTSGPAPFCLEEANVDSDVGNIIDISDLVYLVDFMFTGGPQPGNCP